MLKELLSMESAAKEWGYSPRQFQRLVEQHNVPIKRFEHGTRHRIKFFVLRSDLKSRLAKSKK